MNINLFIFEISNPSGILRKVCRIMSLLMLSNAGFAQQNVAETKIDSILKQPLDSVYSWLDANAEVDIDIFERVAVEGIYRANKSKDDALMGDFYTAVADWHGYHGLYALDSVTRYSELALESFLKTEERAKIADTRRNLAYDYLTERRLVEAQNELFKAIAIYEELGDEVGVAKSYRNLSTSYLYTDEPEKCIEYLDKVTPVFRKVEDFNTLSYCYLSYIDAYGRIEEYEKAIKATDICLDIVKSKVPDEVPVELRAYSARGDIYLQKKDYQQALKDYQKAYDLAAAAIGAERAATWLTEVGIAYLKLENYPLALENLLTGIKAYDKKDVSYIVSPYQSISDSYAKLGDYQNALLYLRKAEEAKDKVHTEQVANLENEGVICDWREPNVIRMAPVALYNTMEDVVRLAHLFLNFKA